MLIQVIQVVLSIILLIRIGGILSNKIDINKEEKAVTNCFLELYAQIAILLTYRFEKGLYPLIFIYICMIYTLVYELKRIKNNKLDKVVIITGTVLFSLYLTVDLIGWTGGYIC